MMSNVCMPVPPFGMDPGDLAAIRAKIEACDETAAQILWHYSVDRRIFFVGVAHARTLHQWVMQPATTEDEAARCADQWAVVFSVAAAQLTMASAMASAGKPH